MTNLEKQRIITTYLNITSSDIDKVINLLKRVYTKGIPNCSEIYRDKLFELEKKFNSKGLSIYSENILTHMLFMHFEALFYDANKVLSFICNGIAMLPPGFIFNKPIIKFLLIFINKYKKRCQELNGFLLENDLRLVIAIYFETNKFENMEALELKYNELQFLLVQLGFDDIAFNLDDIALDSIEFNKKVDGDPLVCVKKIGNIF